MCFSAEASFGAGALLLGAGVVAMRKVDSNKKLAFASIPLFFGLQQVSEGFLWLSLGGYGNDAIKEWSIYSFLFFGKIFWPSWIPIAIWSMEPNKIKRRILSYFILIGLVASFHLLYTMYVNDATAFSSNHHIRYEMEIPLLTLHRVLFLLGAAVPFFISSLKYMKLLGISLLISLVLSIIFYHYHLISVWCFFAAFLSLLVLYIDSINNKNQ